MKRKYYQIGGSAGVPVYGVPLAAGGDFCIIPTILNKKTYIGATANIGIGTLGAEFHVEWGETATWDAARFNIFDKVDDIYTKIMGGRNEVYTIIFHNPTTVFAN